MPFVPFPAVPPALCVKLPPAAPGAEEQAGQSDYQTWDAPRLFQFGTYLLRSGRSFNRAIQVFEIAAQKQPQNADYHLALGCAYACRFASVSEAAQRAKNSAYYEKTYPERRAAWEDNQKNPKSPGYGKPAPAPPRPHLTPDDAHPFSLSPEESRAELVRLAQKSVTAFDEAKPLITHLPADKQAEANYVRGWGLFTLRRAGAGIVADTPPKAKADKEGADKNKILPLETVVISPSDVTECFAFCTKTDGKNAAYWQSLGFSFVPDYTDGKGRLLYWESPHYKKEVIAQAASAFEHALTGKKHDFDVLYSLALITAPTDPASAADYLERAAKRQNSNAALWYLLAEIQFRQVENEKDTDAQEVMQQKGIATIEKGNAAPAYAVNLLPLPLPAWLRAVWQYQPARGYGDDTRVLSILFTRAGDYLKEEDAKNNAAELVRGANTLMGMGVKSVRTLTDPTLGRYDYFGLWQENDTRAGRLLMGIANVYGAYDTVWRSQKARPDVQKARFLEANASTRQYLSEVDQELTQPEPINP